jgi:hypothetical protein
MSFFRHRQIYQSDVISTQRRSRLRLRLRAHRVDEFAASYSLAGCTPALPASASPAGSILKQPAETVNRSLRKVGEFSTGTMGNFQSVLTKRRATLIPRKSEPPYCGTSTRPAISTVYFRLWPPPHWERFLNVAALPCFRGGKR